MIGVYDLSDLPSDDDMEKLENLSYEEALARVVEVSSVKVASSYVDEAMF